MTKATDVEGAVRRDLAALVCRAPMGEALSELACALARMIDDPGADSAHRSPAALAGQLRAILTELAAASIGEDDDDLAALLSGVSTPVRNTEEP